MEKSISLVDARNLIGWLTFLVEYELVKVFEKTMLEKASVTFSFDSSAFYKYKKAARNSKKLLLCMLQPTAILSKISKVLWAHSQNFSVFIIWKGNVERDVDEESTAIALVSLELDIPGPHGVFWINPMNNNVEFGMPRVLDDPKTFMSYLHVCPHLAEVGPTAEEVAALTDIYKDRTTWI